jgi:hypothetical protein
MILSFRKLLVIGCVSLSFAVVTCSSYAVVATGTPPVRLKKEVVYCYFGALRKDGQVMVNMVEGAAGKLYRINPSTPVTLNGASVGQSYLSNGMPIILILRNGKYVEEIQIRTPGGK